MRRLAAAYPGDGGVLAPLFLNLRTLRPGEAVFTGAGVLPSGMEMMDNPCIQAVDDFFGVDEYPREAAAVLLIELDGHPLEVKESV